MIKRRKKILSILLVMTMALSVAPITKSHAASPIQISDIEVCVGGTSQRVYHGFSDGYSLKIESKNTSIITVSYLGTTTSDNGKTGPTYEYHGVAVGTAAIEVTLSKSGQNDIVTTITGTVGDHVWMEDDGLVIDEATCQEEGKTKYRCRYCTATEVRTTPKKPHTPGTEMTVDEEPTCTTDGKKSYHCTFCNEIIPETVVVLKAMGHSIKKHEKIESTCSAQGSEAHWECDTCHKCFSDEAGANEISFDSIALPEVPHVWNSSYTIETAASYWKKGKKCIHCMVCDAVKPDSTVKTAKLKVGVPTLTKAKKKSKTKISLAWTKVKDNTEYEIKYATNKSFKKAKKAYSSGAKKTLSKLKKGKRYYIRVRSTISDPNSADWAFGGWSNLKIVSL